MNTKMGMFHLEQPQSQGIGQKDSITPKQPHKGWDWDKPDTRWEIPFPNIVQNIFATVLCNLNLDLYGLPSLQQTFTLTHAGEDMRGISVVFSLTPCCQIFSSCLTLCIPKNCPKCQAGKWGLIKRAGNSYSYLKKIWSWQKMNFQCFPVSTLCNPQLKSYFCQPKYVETKHFLVLCYVIFGQKTGEESS